MASEESAAPPGRRDGRKGWYYRSLGGFNRKPLAPCWAHSWPSIKVPPGVPSNLVALSTRPQIMALLCLNPAFLPALDPRHEPPSLHSAPAAPASSLLLWYPKHKPTSGPLSLQSPAPELLPTEIIPTAPSSEAPPQEVSLPGLYPCGQCLSSRAASN